MTLSEVLLWDHLKQKQMLGYDFDRQSPIGNYIVDFYCKDLMLALEVDGSSHDHEDTVEKDEIRQKELTEMGICFFRFVDGDIEKHINNVIETIEDWIKTNVIDEEPTPSPSQEGI